MVTSAEPGEGKSMVIVNLALSLAQSGKRVILIDCDLRRPTIHRYFNLPNINGLSSWLEKKLSLVDVIQPATKYSFRVITSGQLPSDPTQILGKLDIKSLIDGLSSEFDYVLLDTPALLGVTDAVILAQSVDAILLIVSRTKSHRDSVQKTCNQLVEVNESIAVVVNRAEQNKKYSYYERNQVPSAKIPKDSDEKNSLKNLPR
jgi:capsular exopolysaccharide synthesis family protein